jgi:hypothetical protein
MKYPGLLINSSLKLFTHSKRTRPPVQTTSSPFFFKTSPHPSSQDSTPYTQLASPLATPLHFGKHPKPFSFPKLAKPVIKIPGLFDPSL